MNLLAVTESIELKAIAKSFGFELVGITDIEEPVGFEHYQKWLNQGFHSGMSYMQEHQEIRKNPKLLLEDAESVLVVGLNYYQTNETKKSDARIARYALGRDYHKVLKTKLRQVGRQIEERWPGTEWRACVDSAPIFEREFAHRAGLGWFGKNTMLINSHRGSWFLLGCLLITKHFEPDQRANGQCGNCRLCINHCPTGAIVFENGRWQVNANDCLSYLTIEHRGPFDAEQESKVADWTFGCDICQEVCPFNQPRKSQPLRANISSEQEFSRRLPMLSNEQIVGLTIDEWDKMTTGSAVRRAGFEGLRRNAQANLKNRSKL